MDCVPSRIGLCWCFGVAEGDCSFRFSSGKTKTIQWILFILSAKLLGRTGDPFPVSARHECPYRLGNVFDLVKGEFRIHGQ